MKSRIVEFLQSIVNVDAKASMRLNIKFDKKLHNISSVCEAEGFIAIHTNGIGNWASLTVKGVDFLVVNGGQIGDYVERNKARMGIE